MEREKLQLPLLSSRITTFEDYRNWDQQRKRAYRAELDQEVQHHCRTRDISEGQKVRERAEMQSQLEQSRIKEEVWRSAKIKTEQKYMAENYQLIGRHSPRQMEGESYREHPFVVLADGEARRREESRNNFIFQNKVNELQSDLKRSMRDKRKEWEQQERSNYIHRVEGQFQRHEQERREFQMKYLKVDKNSRINFKKEHLQYLRDQAQNRRETHNPSHDSSLGTLAKIGLSPIADDRKRQLQQIQKSLKMFASPCPEDEPVLNLKRQFDLKIYGNDSSRSNKYKKVVTEKSAIDYINQKETSNTGRAQSSLNRSLHHVKNQPIISQIADKEYRPTNGRQMGRQFRHYDIIKGSEKVFVV